MVILYRVKVRPVIRNGFVLVGNVICGIEIILHKPATPKVGDAFLIPRRAYDAEGVQVNGSFDDIGRYCLLARDEGRVAL